MGDRNTHSTLGQTDDERAKALEFLRVVNETRNRDELIRAATTMIQSICACDAVAIRLRSGHDYPYADTHGFPPELRPIAHGFCEMGNCSPKAAEPNGTASGCICAHVLGGQCDPTQPFFTQRGSFWTNDERLVGPNARQGQRDHEKAGWCFAEEYRSIALIPLSADGDRFGLLQICDRRPGCLSEGLIEFLEALANQLAKALARSRAENHLAEKEQLYRSLFDNMLNGFAYCVMHFDGDVPVDFTYLNTNPAFEKLTGLQDVIGRRVSEVIPGLRQSDPEIFEIYGRVARSGCAETFETYVSALSTWFSVAAYSPAPNYFVAVFDVITARKKAEEELRRSEQRYRMLIENLDDVVYVVDPKGHITYVSESVSRFGYRPHELIGSTFEPLVYPADIPKAFQLLSEASLGGVSRADIRILGKDGDVFVVTGSARRLLENDKVVGLLGVVSDITAQKQMEQQLIRSQRMEAVGRLAGGIAHDFNNLLTVIANYASIISEQVEDIEPVRLELDEISKATARAARLTRQLLAFSKRQVLETKVVNLNQIVEDMRLMFKRLLGAGIELVTELAPDLNNTQLDQGQFEQVLLNLAVNARDAMPDGGTLTIVTRNQEITDTELAKYGVSRPGPFAVLSVKDTGIGMDDATQARVFEPFFTTKEGRGGTGLGLATVYGIVRQSQGNIVLTSHPGAGTEFAVLLPRCDSSVTGVLTSIRPRRPESANGETILIVEVDEVVRAATTQALMLAGYQVISASNDQEALDLLRANSERIDLVVADVIPQGSLDGLIQRYRAIVPVVRILLTSAYVDGLSAQSELDSQHLSFIAKPFRADHLRNKVREMLDATT